MQPAWRKLLVYPRESAKQIAVTHSLGSMHEWYSYITLFISEALKTSKERHFFQVLCTWKIYGPICVADAVRIACLASALVWKWGWECLPPGVPVTPQPCLTSSLCWLSQFLWSGLEYVLGAGTDCYPRYNVVNFMLYSSLCGS